jgi:3-oxoacyl-[acyl-carrier-protein] synthase II
MSGVWLVDSAVTTAFGDGLDPLWEGLMANRTAIAPVSRFGTGSYPVKLAATLELGLPGPEGSLLPHLLERLLNGFGPVPADSLLLTATTKAGIDALERLHRGESADPAQLLPETLQQAIRTRYGLADDGLNVNAACASSTLALARGAALIASGTAGAVLVCCLDLVSEFVFSGFAALQALSPEPSRPFDRRRNGLTLGEGGAALLLMAEERARREGRRPLATVAGWGWPMTPTTSPPRPATAVA